MAAEVERDGLDAGAAPPLHQELDCNGTGGTRRSGRIPKPAARALAYQGGTSRPARNAQPGQLEAGEPASEDLRGVSSEEEDEAEEEGAGIPIDCRGNRAFFFKGTFIGNNNQPCVAVHGNCKGFVRVHDGSPPMALSAWTTKCIGYPVGVRDVKVVDAGGQAKRSLRDVLDGLSGSEDEEDPTSQYRGVTWNKEMRKWRVEMRATKVGKNNLFLGYFDREDEEDAARMYDRGQIAYLGRKAYVVAYEAGRRNPKQKVANPNFPLAEYSHEVAWLEKLGVLKFKERLKAARKRLKKAKKPATPAAVLQEAGLPSVPGPQQQHGATPMEAEDEEIEIRKLAREGTPPPPLRPAAGQASRPKRSRPAARGDSKAAKRQKPVQVPAQVQPQAAAIAELRQAQALEAQRRDLREAELKEQNEVLLAKVDGLVAKVDGLAAKSAQQKKLSARQERLIAHLERFNAHVLEENEELRRLLLAKES